MDHRPFMDAFACFGVGRAQQHESGARPDLIRSLTLV
jgi:hypothetical protein